MLSPSLGGSSKKHPVSISHFICYSFLFVMAVQADMPHGNSCGVLNLNAIDPVCISKEGHCDGPSFDVRTISVACI